MRQWNHGFPVPVEKPEYAELRLRGAFTLSRRCHHRSGAPSQRETPNAAAIRTSQIKSPLTGGKVCRCQPSPVAAKRRSRAVRGGKVISRNHVHGAAPSVCINGRSARTRVGAPERLQRRTADLARVFDQILRTCQFHVGRCDVKSEVCNNGFIAIGDLRGWMTVSFYPVRVLPSLAPSLASPSRGAERASQPACSIRATSWRESRREDAQKPQTSPRHVRTVFAMPISTDSGPTRFAFDDSLRIQIPDGYCLAAPMDFCPSRPARWACNRTGPHSRSRNHVGARPGARPG